MTTQHARLIAAAPRMFAALEHVNDAIQEPDKWFTEVRDVLASVDGKDRSMGAGWALRRREELRLQRAAPEMLAALEAVQRELRAKHGVEDTGGSQFVLGMRHLETAIDAAIAKAKGGQS